MGIGTSLGAFYEDEFHHVAAPWMDSIIVPNQDGDKNVIHPLDAQDYIANNPKIEEISDTYSISPMTDTENGVFPMMGGAVRPPETIKSAAIQYGKDLFEAPNHGIALGKYMDKYPDIKNFDHLIGRDGFTTTHGRFVSREEAFSIAKKRDQIQEKVLPSLTDESTMLLSEDLK